MPAEELKPMVLVVEAATFAEARVRVVRCPECLALVREEDLTGHRGALHE